MITPLLSLPVLAVVTVLALGGSYLLFYGGKVLPRVSVGGVALGGLTQTEAAQEFQDSWQTVTLRFGEQTWSVPVDQLGITPDAGASAARAYDQGRGEGGFLSGLVRPAALPPVLSVNAAQARTGLLGLAPQLERQAVNAGVQLVNGRVLATPPVDGWTLALEPTLARLQAPDALAGGTLEPVMARVAPAITDASPMVAAAENLLRTDLRIRVYDPVTGDTVYWTLPPAQWATWLVATPDAGQPTGLALTVADAAARRYVESQAAAMFDPGRYIRADEVVASIQDAVAAGSPAGYARVYHHDWQHVVQPGETLISIAWDYGVPYPWIQQANPGLGALSIGQTLTIPSPDNFMDYPVVPNKRIVVSISQQHAWIYEDGSLKWDWPVSTGIADSPTWPGIYQIISHVPNAYAANWNLYMPYFMGVYRPIPGADFTNGFHGFPTRGGSQLLWTNSLGTRVTYGCILLSNHNAELLYQWAQEGVVVEIRA